MAWSLPKNEMQDDIKHEYMEVFVMNNQLSRFLQGLVLALLILGFPHKGSYGEIPVSSKALAADLKQIISSPAFHSAQSLGEPIHSLFVRKGLIILMEHNHYLSGTLRQKYGATETPLIVCASVLPATTVRFEPAALVFKQDDRIWRPREPDLVPIDARDFDRPLTGDDSCKVMILLPGDFDLSQPIEVGYGSSHRTIQF